MFLAQHEVEFSCLRLLNNNARWCMVFLFVVLCYFICWMFLTFCEWKSILHFKTVYLVGISKIGSLLGLIYIHWFPNLWLLWSLKFWKMLMIFSMKYIKISYIKYMKTLHTILQKMLVWHNLTSICIHFNF